MTGRKAFSLQSVLLMTASVAILLGLLYQGQQLAKQAREIATFRKFVGYERPNAPQEPDTFDYHWELLANTSDLRLYLFSVRSGDPHELLFSVNDNLNIVTSYYDPTERTNKSRATVCIDWIASNRIKVTLAADFANAKSLHFFQQVDEAFDYNMVAYPEFSAMVGGANGVYSWDTDPQELFHWNGDEVASLSVRFKTRSPAQRSSESEEDNSGTRP